MCLGKKRGKERFPSSSDNGSAQKRPFNQSNGEQGTVQVEMFDVGYPLVPKFQNFCMGNSQYRIKIFVNHGSHKPLAELSEVEKWLALGLFKSVPGCQKHSFPPPPASFGP